MTWKMSTTSAIGGRYLGSRPRPVSHGHVVKSAVQETSKRHKQVRACKGLDEIGVPAEIPELTG
jgi:hypothetical protein